MKITRLPYAGPEEMAKSAGSTRYAPPTGGGPQRWRYARNAVEEDYGGKGGGARQGRPRDYHGPRVNFPRGFRRANPWR